MPRRRLDLPPALRAVADVGAALARQAPTSRIATVRAGEVFEADSLPPALRADVEREVEAARAAVCERLRPAEADGRCRGPGGRRVGKALDELNPDRLPVRPPAQVHRPDLTG